MTRAAGPPLSGDLTQGSLTRTLLLFALPQIVGNVMQTLNGSINAVWVGRLLGESALAATANANIVMFLLFGLVFGLGMAATVRIGQHYGARDLDAARRTFGSAIGLIGITGLIVTVLGWLLAPQLLDALATPGAARQEALVYLRVIFFSTPAMMIASVLAMGMRGAGDATTPLKFMVVTALLDIALNPLLIMGIGPFPALGIAGSAWASAIATTAGLCGLVAWIYWRDLPLRLRGYELRYVFPRRSEFGFLLGKGIPMGAQMLVISGAGVIMIGLVNREGLLTAAAYGALLQVWSYLQMPSLAMGAAVSAMVAQHIGAHREDRIDAISRAGAIANVIITALLIGVALLATRSLMALFLGSGSPAIDIALHIQMIAIWAYLPFGITIVLFGTLRGYGVVYTQIIVLLASMYGIRLGIYWLLYPRIGADALWWSFAISSLTSLLFTGWAYFFGRWRRRIKLPPMTTV